jgi:hypothetical protein
MRVPGSTRAWLIVLALAAAGATLDAGKIKVEAHRENVDFSTIKTYVWLPSPPPKMDAVAPGVMRDPVAIQKELEPTILATADKELAAHGWKRMDGPGADVQVVYYLAHGVGFNASNVGEYYQYATGYALIVSPLIAPTESVKVMEEGTLIIDVVQDRKAIWRGTASTTINRDNSDEKRIQTVVDAVKKLIDKLPKK